MLLKSAYSEELDTKSHVYDRKTNTLYALLPPNSRAVMNQLYPLQAPEHVPLVIPEPSLQNVKEPPRRDIPHAANRYIVVQKLMDAVSKLGEEFVSVDLAKKAVESVNLPENSAKAIITPQHMLLLRDDAIRRTNEVLFPRFHHMRQSAYGPTAMAVTSAQFAFLHEILSERTVNCTGATETDAQRNAKANAKRQRLSERSLLLFPASIWPIKPTLDIDHKASNGNLLSNFKSVLPQLFLIWQDNTYNAGFLFCNITYQRSTDAAEQEHPAQAMLSAAWWWVALELLLVIAIACAFGGSAFQRLRLAMFSVLTVLSTRMTLTSLILYFGALSMGDWVSGAASLSLICVLLALVRRSCSWEQPR